MTNMKPLASILLVLAVLFMQVSNVAAAPQAQGTTPISGTVQSITTEKDANGTTIVVVTVQDAQGATQTVRVSVETAVSLGLVTLDPTTQEPIPDQTQVGQTVTIDAAAIIEAEEVHPLAQILGEFFGEDPSVIDGYHEDGFGFGVIAQSLWMSQALTGDASAAGLILEAKRTGDYSAFTLPDGSTPQNWGQFKKALREGKDKHNLGIIVSGHANDENSPNGKGKDKGNGKDNGKGNGKDKDKGRP